MPEPTACDNCGVSIPADEQSRCDCGCMPPAQHLCTTCWFKQVQPYLDENGKVYHERRKATRHA